MGPTLGRIRRTNGVAGQIAYSVRVTYPDEPPTNITFVGSVYGGPIILAAPNHQVRVRDPDRFGSKFNPEWIRRFFA